MATSTVWVALRVGAMAYVVQTHVISTTLALGPSMQPTLAPRGDVLLVSHLFASRARRGDVVVANKPTSVAQNIVKRVAAAAGERISAHQPGVVPKNHVWLRGDNADESMDSRSYGAVPTALLRGRVLLRIWPPARAGRLRTQRTRADGE